ncbi:sulfatase [Polaribacter vadi]|uniref:sulfatase n=1 Tax=Polaribacter TaxID=52959 RepID=UPI001C0A2BB4|nr:MULTISPECIES: sulfatase [Polaribacter]MBU3011340.1 sulfatase [Polaribacter vadi]MDO6741152.1 sulfatase [Polaribacter sp. 1_MG-2023]
MKKSHTLLTGIFLIFTITIIAQKKETKPNILFILADDLGYADLSSSGSTFYETPNIDKIANEGIVFTNGYANSRVCSPSRASIMTGKFTARHDITVHIGSPSGEAWRTRNKFTKMLPAEYTHKLPANFVTMPEALKAAGYKTFFTGKWHLGPKGSWPEDHGFDINVGGWTKGGPSGGYFSPYKNPKLKNLEDGENLSHRLAKETVKFMKDNDPKKTGKPFFAYLSFYAVHSPIQTSKDRWKKYQDKAVSQGIAKKGYKMGKYLPIRQVQDNPIYAGLVEQMDDAVGEVLAGLEALGLDENTIVVFTSDNGGVAAGDNFSTSNKPLKAGKGYQFEGGIREPYIIKIPGISKKGDKIDYPVSGADFYPTFLDLAGAKQLPNEHNDGVSLLPLMNGKSLKERALIWHFPHYGNQGGEPSSIIRKGDWKLIHYYEDGRKELYNIAKDISETNDVATTYPDKVTQLNKELFDYLKEVKAKYPMNDPNYSETKAKDYLYNVEHKKMPSLEKQRIKMLSNNFQPNKNWWGSMITKD